MEKVGQLAWAGRWGLPGRRMSYTKGAACPRRRGQCSGGGELAWGDGGPGSPWQGGEGPRPLLGQDGAQSRDTQLSVSRVRTHLLERFVLLLPC